MILIEALKHFSIENLDDDELIIDINYDVESDRQLYDRLIHNFKCISGEDNYNSLLKIEVDDKFLETIKNNELYENYEIDENIPYDLLCAAWLTSQELVCDEIEEWDDMYYDTANYEMTLSDFNFKHTFETDIDLT